MIDTVNVPSIQDILPVPPSVSVLKGNRSLSRHQSNPSTYRFGFTKVISNNNNNSSSQSFDYNKTETGISRVPGISSHRVVTSTAEENKTPRNAPVVTTVPSTWREIPSNFRTRIEKSGGRTRSISSTHLAVSTSPPSEKYNVNRLLSSKADPMLRRATTTTTESASNELLLTSGNASNLRRWFTTTSDGVASSIHKDLQNNGSPLSSNKDIADANGWGKAVTSTRRGPISFISPPQMSDSTTRSATTLRYSQRTFSNNIHNQSCQINNNIIEPVAGGHHQLSNQRSSQQTTNNNIVGNTTSPALIQTPNQHQQQANSSSANSLFRNSSIHLRSTSLVSSPSNTNRVKPISSPLYPSNTNNDGPTNVTSRVVKSKSSVNRAAAVVRLQQQPPLQQYQQQPQVIQASSSSSVIDHEKLTHLQKQSLQHNKYNSVGVSNHHLTPQ